ncbi:Nucleolar protein 9 [Puccinia graminis f. sp. tritici]|uniref:Nucleolar protein 9 n=1 Tax=Puccinia graminis f. sp. tritici TaxID=56615 RepID=A0A5B0PTC3_PUCGR|nr:Nucleolar protein 9 [Puccinia graminis f. sp. tritici]
MPREFRKRGRGGNKQKDGEDYDGNQAAKQPKRPKVTTQDVMEIAQGSEEDDTDNQGRFNADIKDPDVADFPQLTPDLRAYWKEIDEKLQEFERLGLGAYHSHSNKANQNDEAEDDDEDERQLLLRSALTELGGHELALASDPETSIILERVIYSMDGFAKRVLADRFIASFVDLSNHRHGSHVLQTLLSSSADLLDEEAPLNQSNSKKKAQDDSEQDENLPLMSDLLSQACDDILPHLDSIVSSPSGSHVLLVILRLCFGKPIGEENVRSKKSTQWRSKQGSLRSVFHAKPSSSSEPSSTPQPAPSTPADPPRRVPKKLRQKGQLVYAQMRRNWSDKNRLGGVRSIASNPSIVVLLQLIIELEFDRGEAEVPDSLTDIILDGLLQTSFSSERSEFVEVSLRDVTASRVIEGILSRLSPALFSRFHSVYLVGRMGHLCNHPVANFVISRAVSRLDLENIRPAIEEFRPKLVDCIDNYRIGFFKALVERSATFEDNVHKEVIEMILKAFGIDGESDYRWIFPCLISLMRMDYFRKTKMFNLLDSAAEVTLEQVKLPESNVQGSVLLQSILQTLPRSLDAIITKGLAQLPIEVIIGISRDPIGSRALDALLKSPSITPSIRRHFTLRFLGNFHRLADDRIGSHVAETFWTISDVYLKEKIAASLLNQQLFLQKSSFGHFFLKKLELPLFERQREAWKSKMLLKFPRLIPPSSAVKS